MTKSEKKRESVAQSCTLPYCRFAICGGFESSAGFEVSCTLPTPSRRYSRLKICVTLVFVRARRCSISNLPPPHTNRPSPDCSLHNGNTAHVPHRYESS